MKIKMHNSISDFSDLSDLEREFNKDEKLEVRGIELEKTCLKMNIGVNENKGHEIKGLEDFVDDLQENVDKTMIEKREGKILDQNLEDIYKELMEILHEHEKEKEVENNVFGELEGVLGESEIYIKPEPESIQGGNIKRKNELDHEIPYKYTMEGFLDPVLLEKNAKISGNAETSENVTIFRSIMAKNREEFKCTECTRSFKRKYNLKRHMMVRHVEKVTGCVYCGLKFKRVDNLKRHQDSYCSLRPLD